MSRIGPLALVAAAVWSAGCGAADPCDEPGAGTACRIAGTGEAAFNDDGRPAAETALYLPSQVKRGPDGRIYIMDFNNQRLRAMEPDGTVTTVAGSGWHGFATEGAPAVDSPLENPVDFDFDAEGRIVFVSYHDPRVLRIDEDGTIAVLAGSGEIGDDGDGGPALAARFNQLNGVAVAADGTIYVSDALAGRVRMIRDGVVDTLLGPETLSYPTALALDGEERVLVADYAHNLVRRASTDGELTIVAGNGEARNAGDGGLAVGAPLHGPNGLAVAPDGTVYIASRDGFCIRRVGPDGIIETVAGAGVEGFSGSGGPALEARFGFLAGLSVDVEAGGASLLVADQTNNAVWRVILP
jgi:sugar lactone lactonase YvrE